MPPPRSCGRWRINPTVSASTVSPDIRHIDTTQRGIQRCEQLVCRIHLRFGDVVKQRRLAGVGITHQRNRWDIGFRAGATPLFTLLFNLLKARRIWVIRLRNKRRSVSSWVSPGPRKPIPPFVVQGGSSHAPDASPGWRNCASSTCNFPSCVRARWAKISKNQAGAIDNTALAQSFRLRSGVSA